MSSPHRLFDWSLLCRHAGVTRQPNPSLRPWVAKISVNGAIVYLGSFASVEEAARAYDKAALQHHKGKATLNFPHEHGQHHQPLRHDDDNAMVEGEGEGASGGGGGQGHSPPPRAGSGRSSRYRGE